MQNVIRRLRNIKIQGASSIALHSLLYLRGIAARKGFGAAFERECRNLLVARPTAVDLYNCIRIMKKEKSLSAIDRLMDEIRQSRHVVAEKAEPLFRRRRVILTHCHSSYVTAAIIMHKRKVRRVIVTETRPKNQGMITAKELLSKNVKIDYIIDSASGAFMKNTDFVLVGADALRKEGVINKIGTYPIAIVAREQKKPVYVATSLLSVDKRKGFTMEQRPVSEVARLKRAHVHNPAFDITPWRYVTGIVTEKGIENPPCFVRKYL